MSRAKVTKKFEVIEGTRSPHAMFIAHVQLSFPNAPGRTAKRSKAAGKKPVAKLPTLAESNRWLNENWGAVVAHATESTKRLIGHDSL
jgi:hypothetical protein